MLLQLLLTGEGDRVDPLQTVIGHLSKPVSSRVFHHFEALDQLSRGYVRSRAEIDQIAAAIRCDALAILNFPADSRNLERIGLEQVQSLRFGEDETLEDLLLTGDLFGAFVDRLVVFLGKFLYQAKRRQSWIKMMKKAD